MKNLGQFMKQAQQMQARMQEIQTRLESVEMTGTSGGGLVSVTLSGKGVMRKVKIDPSLMQPGEVEVLEDLVAAAYADAKSKVEENSAKEVGELTGGLQLPPGMKLPF